MNGPKHQESKNSMEDISVDVVVNASREATLTTFGEKSNDRNSLNTSEKPKNSSTITAAF